MDLLLLGAILGVLLFIVIDMSIRHYVQQQVAKFENASKRKSGEEEIIAFEKGIQELDKYMKNRPSLKDGMMKPIRITIEEKGFTQLVNGEVVAIEGSVNIQLLLADIGLHKIQGIVNKAVEEHEKTTKNS